MATDFSLCNVNPFATSSPSITKKSPNPTSTPKIQSMLSVQVQAQHQVIAAYQLRIIQVLLFGSILPLLLLLTLTEVSSASIPYAVKQQCKGNETLVNCPGCVEPTCATLDLVGRPCFTPFCPDKPPYPNAKCECSKGFVRRDSTTTSPCIHQKDCPCSSQRCPPGKQLNNGHCVLIPPIASRCSVNETEVQCPASGGKPPCNERVCFFPATIPVRTCPKPCEEEDEENGSELYTCQCKSGYGRTLDGKCFPFGTECKQSGCKCVEKCKAGFQCTSHNGLFCRCTIKPGFTGP